MKLIIKLSLFFIFLLPLQSLAELPQQIKNDFAPLSGVIIMPVGEQYLIDLDATSGLKEGDILSLTVPGEKIIHPVTKEILGSLDIVRGFMQVSQVKSGYSYAKIITAQITPQKGTQIKRFEQVPAIFSAPVKNSTLEAEVKTGLPNIKWIDANSNDVPQLTFSLSGSTLQVKNIEGVTIRSYQNDSGQLSALPTTTVVQNAFKIGAETNESKSTLNRAVGNILGSVGIGSKDKRLENPGIIRSPEQSGDIWMGSNLEGNPVGLTVGDYDGDGQQEIAVAFEDYIQIIQINNGKQSLIETIKFSGGLHLLSLDSIDMDKNGHPELYISANNGTQIRSQVVEYRNDRYQITIAPVQWLLRVVDLPQHGPTLIGQLIDSTEKPFTNSAFKVTRQQDKLQRAEAIPSPNQSFFSFAPFTDNNNDLLYAYTSAGDYLNVSSSQMSRIWESGENFGGSEEFFYNRTEKSTETIQPIYIQKRLIKLTSGDILAAQNEGPRIMQRYRDFSKSRVIALKWDGFTFVESWRTSQQGGYLADFTLADADNDGKDELVMAITYSRKNLLQKGRSTVVIYELN
jgi:FG-GAP-like repeat